jgi:hypothetical protein
MVGWVADHLGARWGLGVGALAGIVAAMIGLRFLCPRTACSDCLCLSGPFSAPH